LQALLNEQMLRATITFQGRFHLFWSALENPMITQFDQLFRIAFPSQYRVNDAQTTDAGDVTDKRDAGADSSVEALLHVLDLRSA